MKKQFRLYDIYRCAVTGEQSSIKGIREYHVRQDEDKVLYINVLIDTPESNYPARWASIYSLPKEEKRLRHFIKELNKRLIDCKRPGPKKHS